MTCEPHLHKAVRIQNKRRHGLRCSGSPHVLPQGEAPRTRPAPWWPWWPSFYCSPFTVYPACRQPRFVLRAYRSAGRVYPVLCDQRLRAASRVGWRGSHRRSQPDASRGAAPASAPGQTESGFFPFSVGSRYRKDRWSKRSSGGSRRTAQRLSSAESTSVWTGPAHWEWRPSGRRPCPAARGKPWCTCSRPGGRGDTLEVVRRGREPAASPASCLVVPTVAAQNSALITVGHGPGD